MLDCPRSSHTCMCREPSGPRATACRSQPWEAGEKHRLRVPTCGSVVTTPKAWAIPAQGGERGGKGRQKAKGKAFSPVLFPSGIPKTHLKRQSPPPGSPPGLLQADSFSILVYGPACGNDLCIR